MNPTFSWQLIFYSGDTTMTMIEWIEWTNLKWLSNGTDGTADWLADGRLSSDILANENGYCKKKIEFDCSLSDTVK